MSHDDHQNVNPFAYHEAAVDLSDKTPLQKPEFSPEQQNTFLRMGCAMVLPSLLLTVMSILTLLHILSDYESMNRVTLFDFFWMSMLFLALYGIPWLITVGVTVGLFRNKRWAVNIGMVFSFLPTLLALWLGLMFLQFLAFLPFFLCAAYNIGVIRAKLAISQNISTLTKEPDVENEFD